MTRLLSQDEVAAMLRVAPGTVKSWRAKRTGPAYVRISHKSVGYTEAAVDAWIKANTVEAAS